MSGWIKIHRKILDWEWYNDHNTFRLFFYLLIKANHEDRNYKGDVIKRGQHICSLTGLAKETNLTVKQVRLALSKLKETHEIDTITGRKGTKITIRKYDQYQMRDDKEDTIQGRKRARKGQEKGNSEELKNIRIKEDKNNIPKKSPKDYPSLLFTEDQQKKLVARYDEEGVDLRKGLETLEAYAENNKKKFAKYESHYHVMIGWVLIEVKKQKKIDMDLERSESYLYKSKG